MTIREKSEFDNSNAKGTGGLTGSVKVSLNQNPNEFYQLKPSIVDNTLRRRIKAGGTDRENFGEVIAASINRRIFGNKAAPEVSFVYDNDEGKTLIASKYLSGAIVKTLDDYGKKLPEVSTTKKHIKLVKGDGIQDEKLGVDHPSISPLKQGIADAIAQSAFVGDHDVNPGNIMVIINKEDEPQVTRIDFGHALNDLLNAPKKFGGRVRDKENPMMDFLNRKSVAGLFPPGDLSKLWRDYPGIVFTKEMVNAYRKIGDITLEQLEGAITEAKHKYIDLLSTMQDDNNEAGITHVHRSLGAIYQNMTGASLPEGSKVLDDVFKELERFLKKNRSNALEVANTLEIQLLIDERLNSKMGMGAKDIWSIKKEFREKTGKNPEDAIQWVRSDPDSLALHDNLHDYILKRAKKLNVIIHQETLNPTTAYREHLMVNKFIDDANHKRAALFSELKMALTSDYAQKIINEVKNTGEGQLSHLFDKLRISYRTSISLYEQFMGSIGKDVLYLDVDNLSTKINKAMSFVTKDIAKALLSPDDLGLKKEVKLAIGSSYDALEEKIGSEKTMTMLLQAALSSYAQAMTKGFTNTLGIITDKDGVAVNATNEQLQAIQDFSTTITKKINQFIEKIDINYVKLTTLHQTLGKAIHQLEKYRAGLPTSTENIDQMNDIRSALTSLTHLKDDLSLQLTNMDESGDYSTAKALSTKTADELGLIIQHKILDKPNLVQLHGFFENLLNVIVTTFTLGYKNYTSSAMKALEELESHASDRTKPGGLSG